MKPIARTWCALSGFILLSANPLLADHWESRAQGPGARVAHSVVFTGHEVIVWGGARANTWLNDGARYDAATDTWTPISANHNLAGRWWHAAVWTGNEMIVWGGRGAFFPQQHHGDGARYNPATDTWTPMSGAGAPSPRSQLSAVWTGTEMIVWGGTGDDFNEKGDGARYNPETDTWTPLPAAPLDARLQPTAVWSGSEMIIFGGRRIDNDSSTFGDGAAYNPANNTWRVLSTNNAPRSRSAHTAVWTGKEMMVWGGRYLPDETFLNSGGSYDPVQDRWTPISENGAPQARAEHAAVWSGTELIVWGGYVDPSPIELATGGRYNPVSRTWTATTMEGAPQARFFGGGIASVWTGHAMFIYGGWDYPTELNTTALYYPSVVTWLSPPNGASFLPGATISLMASVVTNAAVSFVEFFAASTNQMMNLGRGTLTSNNVYLLPWSNAPAGTFQMHAEAEDNLGRRGVSGSVQIRVATPTNITWTGADPSGYWSAPANWFPAGVPTNGADLVFPGGLPLGGLPPEDMVSTNDLTGSIFRSIRFDQASRHTIRGNPITLTNRTDVIINSGTNVIACDLTFSGTPSTPTSATIRGSGSFGSGELTVIGNVGGGSLYVFSERLVIRGQFTGGSLHQQYGTLALYGDNPYPVSAFVEGSTLLVQGSQPNLNIRMSSNISDLTPASLSGDGLVGDVTRDGITHITPDPRLSVKNVSAHSLFIRLNGPNVGEYGRLVASGNVNLTSGGLLPSAGFIPQAGQVFTILEKTSPGPITSAFLGPEGTLTTLNGMPFRISYVGGDGNDVTLTDVRPVVTVVASDATASESGDIGMFTITRTGIIASSLTINYTLSGTAENGTDYNSLSGSVTILAGATVSVVPIDDTAFEGNETVTLTLAANNFYIIGSPNSATVTIIDNDPPQTHFVNFETAPVHPIALGPDGQTLVVCNLPDNRLEIFDVSGGVPIPTGSVPVGLDPVTARFASSNELWVVNHISSSVSIIDLASLNVIATLDTPAGPSDVVFAGNPRRAWISCSRTNSVLVVDPTTRAAVANIAIDGERPRAMATSPDGTKVYVAIFESGNGSTILGRRLTELFVGPPPGPLDDSNSPYAGADPPPNSGTAFSPPINPALTGLPPRVSHIVRKNVSGRWMDDNNADWTEWVSGTKASISGRIQGWDLPDRDLAVIDTATLQVTYARRLMNICMAVAVNPASGQIAVVGTDATNERRFEPNLKGVFLRINLALVDPVTLTNRIRDLNPHLDYITRSLPPAQRALALGDPRGIEWNAAGTRAYVTGMGSRNLVVIDADGARVNSQPIDLGEGPTGMALDEARSRVYVWNRFSSTISVVDTEAGTVMTNISVFDPTPDIVRKGRRHLYDTRANSGLGIVACGSCHVDARVDRLAWDLGDPAGGRATNGFFTFHPMKGPMVTQTFQDIITPTNSNRRQLPLHWRGDRTNIEAFNVTFPALLARDTQLASNEMAEFKGMLQSISFPPNYLRTFSNTLPTSVALPGLFGRTNTGVRQPLPAGNPQAGLTPFTSNCRFCHTFNQGTGGGLSNQVLTLSRAGTEGAFKTSQLRNLLDRLGMDALSTNSRAGFGFMHDGRVDSLTHFLNAGFPQTVPNDTDVANLVAFMLCFSGSDFGQAPISPSQDVPSSAGKQVTFAPSAPPQLVTEMFNLASRANSRLEFIVRGKKNGLTRNWLLRRGTANFQSDRHGEIAATLNDILAGATSEFTAMLVPQNTGWRLALDRDEDGYLNASELEAGSDPGDPSSYPGRILRIARAGSDILLSWQSVPGARYTIQWRTNWPPATWLDAVPRVTSSLPITVWTDSPPATDPRRYYRLRTDP